MDFLHMPKGTGGMTLVLVAIDCFSRYILAWPFRGAPSSSMVLKGMAELSQKFVTPKRFYLDNASAFKSREVEGWVEEKGSSIEWSTPYAHVGVVENANHQVLERLRRIANLDVGHIPQLTDPEYPKRWPSQLQEAVARCNERCLTYLAGHSPKTLLFGAIPSAERYPEVDAERRILFLDLVRTEATAAFLGEQAKRRARIGSWNSYAPKKGDLVLAYDATSLRTFDTRYKLKTRWTGPFKVTSVERRSVWLESVEGRPRGKVPWNMVKRWSDGRTTVEQGEGAQGDGRTAEGRDDGETDQQNDTSGIDTDDDSDTDEEQ